MGGGRYELMPPMIEALREAETPTSILTKSPLVLARPGRPPRARRGRRVSVNFSVPTLDEKIWRETEPHTPHPRKRLEAVAKLQRGRHPSGVLIAPLMPGINDSPELVEEIVSIAEEAGATFVNGIALHLRPGVKEVFMSWLSAARPDLVPATRASTRAAPTRRMPSGSGSAPWSGRRTSRLTRATAAARGSRRGAGSGAERRPSAELEQTNLF